jgi:hypothetical protein
MEPFKTIQEINEYLSGDRIQCLICCKWYKTLANHLHCKHDMSVREYKLHFNIPLTRGYALMSKELGKHYTKQGEIGAQRESFKKARKKVIKTLSQQRTNKPLYFTKIGSSIVAQNLPKTKGKILGSKLDVKYTEIVGLLADGKTRTEIAKFYNVSWATVDKFIKRRNLKK